MKKDMQRILITRPRHGSSTKNPDSKHYRREQIGEDYDGPAGRSIRPKVGTWLRRKDLNEYLNPLTRFLDKSVGRSWDKVYSEIREQNPGNSVIGAHIYQHLFNYVVVKPIFKNGKVYSDSGYLLSPTHRRGSWHSYYVDSQGILRRPKVVLSVEEKKDPVVVPADNGMAFFVKRETDGVWFAVEYAKEQKVKMLVEGIPYTCTETPGIVMDKDDIPFPRIPGCYPNKLRTLSKKEKKKYKLS